MNTHISYLLLTPLLLSSYVMAADFIAADIGQHHTSNQQGAISNTFIDNEAINMSFELNIAKPDVGTDSDLFLVAQSGAQFYMMTANRTWLPWDHQRHTLQPYQHKTLAKSESITVLKAQKLPAGEYLAYAGYRNRDAEIIYHKIPASLFVFADNNKPLQHVQHTATLNEFILRSQNYYLRELGDFSPPVTTADSSGESASSQTNVQETGVDEADRIKVVGSQLFALENCQEEQAECLTLYALEETPASSTQLAQIEFEPGYINGRIYYYQNNNEAESASIIRISEQGYLPSFAELDHFPMPAAQQLDVQFVNIDATHAFQLSTRLSIQGSLVSSRVLDDRLYLLTQYYASHIDPASVPEDADAMIPRVSINQQDQTPLFAAQDCYITPRDSESQTQSSLVSIIEIPLHDPEAFSSTCIAGTVETLYASTKALYLASTRYNYQNFDNEIIYAGVPDYHTDIHKFSFADSGIIYKASGQVRGHLGWENDKKSFRMGEHNDILKVATSIGESWNNSASTQVTVLAEDSASQQLKQLAMLGNLGKPGERLYAARFIGDRGFLVTFKVTDPLIMLDFSDAASPQLLGELEIGGYSDYLQPIGENYLLGIGKDAIADVEPERGAWYQGLKLSLFDISNPAAMFEVNNVIIGQRGTNSALLTDHHALAWLAGDNGQPGKLAIPVDLHTQPVDDAQPAPLSPWQFYNWTHTGLYNFEINTTDKPGIRLAGKLLSEQYINEDQQPANTRYDRAVIQGDSVHYIHNNQVLSSAWDALQQ